MTEPNTHEATQAKIQVPQGVLKDPATELAKFKYEDAPDPRDAELSALRKQLEEVTAKLTRAADAAESAIRGYRCHRTLIEGDGGGFPLTDKLVPPNGAFADGEEEMNMLVDAVCGEMLNSTPDIRDSLVTARAERDAAQTAARQAGEAMEKMAIILAMFPAGTKVETKPIVDRLDEIRLSLPASAPAETPTNEGMESHPCLECGGPTVTYPTPTARIIGPHHPGICRECSLKIEARRPPETPPAPQAPAETPELYTSKVVMQVTMPCVNGCGREVTYREPTARPIGSQHPGVCEECQKPAMLATAWIAASERLPERGETVLAWVRGGKWGVAELYYCDGGPVWILGGGIHRALKWHRDAVTHWQPLPSAPIVGPIIATAETPEALCFCGHPKSKHRPNGVCYHQCGPYLTCNCGKFEAFAPPVAPSAPATTGAKSKAACIWCERRCRVVIEDGVRMHYVKDWDGEIPVQCLAEKPKALIKYEMLIAPLRLEARRLGYTLAVHGSLARDIDLIAVPWMPEAASAAELAESLRKVAETVNGLAAMTAMEAADPHHQHGCPGAKPHGRLGWCFHLGDGGTYIDLVVMPRVRGPEGEDWHACPMCVCDVVARHQPGCEYPKRFGSHTPPSPQSLESAPSPMEAHAAEAPSKTNPVLPGDKLTLTSGDAEADAVIAMDRAAKLLEKSAEPLDSACRILRDFVHAFTVRRLGNPLGGDPYAQKMTGGEAERRVELVKAASEVVDSCKGGMPADTFDNVAVKATRIVRLKAAVDALAQPMPAPTASVPSSRPQPTQEPPEEVASLPNGCTLFRQGNKAGGHTYYSDEVGGGVMVWDTCLVSESTLLAAMTAEHARSIAEYHAKERLAQPTPAPSQDAEQTPRVPCRDDYACKVCGATPDPNGMRRHGRGCYTQSADGGGEDYVAEADVSPQQTIATPAPEAPEAKKEGA